ncbi:MAG: TIGR03564 family F420-dependent LLM class oxidoreductase [Actinomycetota bacterium]
MEIGINGTNTLLSGDLSAIRVDIQAAETDGFSAYWLAQSGSIDALTVYAAHGAGDVAGDGAGGGAGHGGTELGTAVIPTWTVHPQAVAAQALTTQAAIGGRLVLGLGLSHEPTVRTRWKLEWERPVRQMLDFLDILQPLLTDGAADHDGHFWSYSGEIQQVGTAPKVMLAALGEQMLRIAGRRTDGTVLWCVGPKTLRDHIAPTINAAAADADRPNPAIVCSLPVWVTDDPGPARDFLDLILASYAELPSYAAMLEREGVDGIGELAIVGSEAEVTDRIGALEDAGATQLSAAPVGGSPEETARTRSVLVAAQTERTA